MEYTVDIYSIRLYLYDPVDFLVQFEAVKMFFFIEYFRDNILSVSRYSHLQRPSTISTCYTFTWTYFMFVSKSIFSFSV